MRIGWFTPFADGTAIAGFSARVCAALAALGHEPVILRIDDRDRPAHAFAGEVIPWRFWPHLHGLAAIFHNIGDDFAEYAPAYDLIRRRRGIVLFHDRSLVGYFAARDAARGVAAPAIDATTSLGRVAVEASGAVVVGGAADPAIVADCGGPLLEAPDGAADAAAFAARLAAFAGEVAASDPIVRMLAQAGDRLDDIGVARGDPLLARIAVATRSLFPITGCG